MTLMRIISVSGLGKCVMKFHQYIFTAVVLTSALQSALEKAFGGRGLGWPH